MYLPPFIFGTPGAIGQLILGGREPSLEEVRGPVVTVPRADFLPAMIAAYARNEGQVSEGKWFLAVDDVLVNGVSTGACATSELGKCLAFTDSGAPLVQVDNAMIPGSEADKMAAWKRAHSVAASSDPAIADCTSVLPTFPLNLTLRIDGVDFTANAQDMQSAIAEHSAFCELSVKNGTLGSLFGPIGSMPYFKFPGPLIYVGNPWLRNFYITNTMPTGVRGAPGSTNASITIGCAANGAGVCTTLNPSAFPTAFPTANRGGGSHGSEKLSAGDDAGITVGALALIAIVAVIGMYIYRSKVAVRRSAGFFGGDEV
jgi:hypothetical protein